MRTSGAGPRLSPALRSVAFLGLSMGIGGVLGLLARVLFGRTLPVDDFGALWAALSGAGLLVPLSVFGVGSFWLLAHSEEGLAARRWFRPSMVLVILCTTVSVLLLLAWSVAGGPSSAAVLLPVLVAPVVLVYTVETLSAARYSLEERFLAVSVVQIADKVVVAVAALATFALGLSVGPAGTALFVAGLAAAVALVPTLTAVGQGRLRLPHRDLVRPSREVLAQRPTVLASARRAWPFALAAVSYTVFQQVDVVLLNALDSSEAAGIYAAAVTFVVACYLLPAAVERYLVPLYFRWSVTERPRLIRVHRASTAAMAACGVVVGGVIALSAGWLVPALFGEEYQDAVHQLQLLCIGIAFRFAATPASALLNTRGNERVKSAIVAVAAIGNIVLNLFLIPAFGVTGATTATVVGEIALALGFMVVARRDVRTS